MFLTASNLVHYLCAQGTVSSDCVVNDEFCVIEAGRRNRNYKVLRKTKPSLFVKQVGSTDAMALSTLQREVACYQLMQRKPVLQSMAALMPRLVKHDPHRHVLITELLPAAESLNEFFQRTRQFPVRMGALLGESLGRCHALVQLGQLNADDLAVFPKQVPWILSFHHTHAHLTNQHSAVSELLKTVTQYPEFYSSLDRLRLGWRYDSMIHGDMKWDNCMVYRGADQQDALTLIDWELVDYGDSAWDVGGVLHAFVASWMYTMPFHTHENMARLMKEAVCPLEHLFPAIRAFWAAYCSARGLGGPGRSAYLLRCVEFAAARMIQTVFEHLGQAQTMSYMGASLLQVSQNMLSNPEHAARELFGLSLEGV